MVFEGRTGDTVEVTSNSPDDERLGKKWGFIEALPSEYLIHFRKGGIRERTSGQGASCFKRPWDTVFIIPTSLKEITFEAHQLTKDNVDVRIRGMAVYRISDPPKIYRLINFSNRQVAEGKLARMIGDMCRSTAKWLVANMNVEECMRKRKEEIAESLKREVSIVVADESEGWGVEIITIYIQDVFIHDGEIFNAMQMLFKSEKMSESELAHLSRVREVETRRIEMDRDLAEKRKQNDLEKVRIEAEITDEQIRLKRQNDEKQFELDRFRVEQNEGIANYKQEQDIAREKQRSDLMLERTRKEAEAQRVLHEEEYDALRTRIDIENGTSPSSLEMHFIEKALPEIARAVAATLQNVRMSVFQGAGSGGGSMFSYMLTEIIDVLRGRLEGLNLDKGDNVDKGVSGNNDEVTKAKSRDEVDDQSSGPLKDDPGREEDCY